MAAAILDCARTLDLGVALDRTGRRDLDGATPLGRLGGLIRFHVGTSRLRCQSCLRLPAAEMGAASDVEDVACNGRSRTTFQAKPSFSMTQMTM